MSILSEEIKSHFNLQNRSYIYIHVDCYLVVEQDFCSSVGRVIRASASGVVDLGLIPSWVKPMTLKLVFTASLLDVQH